MREYPGWVKFWCVLKDGRPRRPVSGLTQSVPLLRLLLLLAAFGIGCTNAASPVPVATSQGKPAPGQVTTKELPPSYPPATFATSPPKGINSTSPATPAAKAGPDGLSNLPPLTILGVPGKLTVYVVEIVDGDTFMVETADGRRDRVRLLGVDTPETQRPNQPGEYGNITDTACLDGWGRRAREFAAIKLNGREVTLELEGNTFNDLFSLGRLLAFVTLDEEDFNAALLQQGLARAFTEIGNSRLKHARMGYGGVRTAYTLPRKSRVRLGPPQLTLLKPKYPPQQHPLLRPPPFPARRHP